MYGSKAQRLLRRSGHGQGPVTSNIHDSQSRTSQLPTALQPGLPSRAVNGRQGQGSGSRVLPRQVPIAPPFPPVLHMQYPALCVYYVGV